MVAVLALDPGESTGWCFRDRDGKVYGGTVPKDHYKVSKLIEILRPDIVVHESFHLYPQMAKSLAWNSFYPCEVIGVIKIKCIELGLLNVDQSPSVKKYFGGFKEDWNYVAEVPKGLVAEDKGVTEHTKDAYMHLKYFERNKEKKLLK